MLQRLNQIRSIIRRHPFFTALLSLGWNLTFALINLVLSVIYGSWWYVTVGCLYLLLGLMRLSTVTLPHSRRRSEQTLLRQNALGMGVLAVVVCGMTILTIRNRYTPAQNKIVMIIAAAYTFAFVILCIRNSVIAQREKSVLLIVLRNISLASAAIAMLSLARSMMGTFGDGYDETTLALLAVTGALAFVLLIGLAVGMLIQSKTGRLPPDISRDYRGELTALSSAGKRLIQRIKKRS